MSTNKWRLVKALVDAIFQKNVRGKKGQYINFYDPPANENFKADVLERIFDR